MRGALTRTFQLIFMVGIIPAHAGSTFRLPHAGRFCRDHPRACGEHAIGYTMHHLKTGSSPRMRGALGSHAVARIELGIIPAHAGSTRGQALRMSLRRDHPRACGEHLLAQVSVPLYPGSSPRMRGAHQVTRFVVCAYGIIPAHAGSTRATILSRLRIKDHPRACGEHVHPGLS